VRLITFSANRAAAASSSVRHAAAGTTPLDVWAFVLPALSFLQIKLVGQLIVSEMLALAILPWLLHTRERVLVPRWLIGLGGAWLVFQVVTDLVVQSAFADWSRGWAAIIFTLIDLAVVVTLVSTPRRARLFALGLAAAGLLGSIFAPNLYAAADPWKFAFAVPVALILAAVLSGAAAGRRPWLAVGTFAAFGVLNAFLQYRSLSGVALITAAYLLLAVIAPGWRPLQISPIKVAAAGLVYYGAAAVIVFVGLNAATQAGLFGGAAKAKYEAQATVVATASPVASSGQDAAASPVGAASPVAAANPMLVLAGGRAEILASSRAILDSPILGHGSWAKDPKYVQEQRQGLVDLGILGGNQPSDPNLIPAHSYLMQSWVWAGLAGGIFWLLVAALAIWLMANLYTSRIALSPLIVFATTLQLWNIAFSPYGNTARLLAAFSIAVCLLALRHGRVPGPMAKNMTGHPLEARSVSSNDPGAGSADQLLPTEQALCPGKRCRQG
jgi:hypothetical protein